MADKEEKQPEQNTKGTVQDLRTNAVDPSDIIIDMDDPRRGKPKFLVWTTKKDQNGNIYYEAVGKDKTVYKIVEDVPEPVVKQYKVDIVVP